MAATVKRSKRFRKFAFGIALAGTLACAACAFAAPPPMTAFAEENGNSPGSFVAPAIEDIASPIAGDAVALDNGSSQDVYLSSGDRYDVGNSGHLETHVYITSSGTYTLTGSSKVTTVHITAGEVTVYLENGLDIAPSALANEGNAASAITVSATSGDVRLVSNENATVKLGGYLQAPSINKTGEGCTLYFQTSDPSNPGNIICDRTSYTSAEGSAVAIGTMDANVSTVSNIVFQSGRVTAKGANSAAGIGNAAGSSASVQNVTGIVFEGTADVTAVGGAWGAPGIGSMNGSTTGIVIRGDAKVTATGTEGSPGIGSGAKGNPCPDSTVSVTIEGGQVIAEGGKVAAENGAGAPGIGTPEGSVDIRISGGSVSARGNGGDPGIGTGANCSKTADIEITDGLVTVNGGQENEPAIGTASYTCAVNVKISGGTVDVKPGTIGVPEGSGNHSGSKVVIDGGSILTSAESVVTGQTGTADTDTDGDGQGNGTGDGTSESEQTDQSSTVEIGPMKIFPDPVNSMGEEVYPVTIAFEEKTDGFISGLTIEGLGYAYGTKDIQLRNRNLYLWLPSGGTVTGASDTERNIYGGTVAVKSDPENNLAQGTLYLESNVILSGEGASSSGSARISLSGTVLSDVVAPTRDGYTVSGYRSPNSLIPVVDGTSNRVVSGDSEYVGELGTWIYSGSYPVTLVASWKPISYSIEFDSNVPLDASTVVDETMPSKNNLTFGENTSLPENEFVLDGYRFVGWNTEPNGSGNSFADGQTISGEGIVAGSDSGPYTLYAQWEPIEYTVTFTSGTEATGEPRTQTLTFDQEAVLDPVGFTSENAGFAGWTSSNGNTYADGATVENLCTFKDDGTPAGCMLTAQWAPKDSVSVIITKNDKPVDIQDPETSIKLQPMDGTTGNEITNFQKKADGIYVRKNVPNGTYRVSFDSSHDTSGVTVVHSAGTHTPVLLAYYDVTVSDNPSGHASISLNGSTSSSANPSITTVLKGKTVKLSATAESGYAFDKYSCVGVKPGDFNVSSGTEQNIVINGKVDISAWARGVTYTVHFDPNIPEGASSAPYGEMESLIATYGETITLPKNEFRLNGYLFKGWKLTPDGTETPISDEGELEKLPTGDDGAITLYANWNVQEYIISFNRNVPKNASTGDEGNHGNTSNMYNLAYDQEHKLTENGFTLPGYEFVGWNTSLDGTGTYFGDEEYVRNLTAENNEWVALYAQWRPLTYTIEFDAGSGSGTMEELVVAFDETVQLPACTLTEEGRTFSYWSTSDDKHYADGASVKNLCGKPTNTSALPKSVTLTANWTDANNTTVIVRLDGEPIESLSTEDVKLKAIDGSDTGNTAIKATSEDTDGECFYFTGLEDGYYAVEIAGYNTGQTIVECGKTVTLDFYSVTIKTDSPNSTVANIENVRINGKIPSKEESIRVLGGTVVSIGATPKYGYVFDHYNAGGVEPTWDPSIAEQNIVINGKVDISAWARGATFTVHFDPNIPEGASTATQLKGAMKDQTAVYGTSSKLFENRFDLPGYKFAGWKTIVNGTEFEFGDSENLDTHKYNFPIEDGETITFYAQWTPNQYAVEYFSAETNTTLLSGPINFDSEFTLAYPSTLGFIPPVGKTFLGWTTNDGNCYLAGETVVNVCSLNNDGGAEGMNLTAMWADSSTTTVTITDDDKLSSRFTAKDVKFKDNNSGIEYSSAGEANEGIFTLAEGPTSTISDDSTFSIYINGVDTGIDVSKGGVAKVPYCTVEIIGDLHAKAWFFDPKNNEPISDPALVVVDSEIGITAEVDQGYHFESYTAIGIQPEWNSEQANQTVTINGKALIEAHSVNNVYTVTFDANGGTGTMEPQDMVYGEPQNLFANAFSQAGYTFAGWNTEADGTGTNYSDGERVSNLTATDQGVVLYAQWSRIPSPTPPTNNVESETTGHGNVTISPQNAKPGEMVTVTAQPDKGYGVFSIEVIDSAGNQLPLADNGDGTYSFEMPKSAVTANTTFKVILPFSDLDWHHWAYDDIALACERGLMTGYDSGLFGADDVTTRAMAITVIWRLAGCPQASADMPFADVADGQWYTEAIRWAAEAGITTGYEGTGLFGPEDDLTREQVVMLLMRYAEAENMDTSNRADISSFPDGDAVSGWAQEAVEWAVAEGLLRGNDVTKALDPQGGGTRGALAVLTMRYDTMLPVGPVS